MRGVRKEMIIQEAGFNSLYFSVTTDCADGFFPLCERLCADLCATHAYFDSVSRVNHRLHRVIDDGAVEKNPISVFRGLPGLFRWNFYGTVYLQHLRFQQLVHPMRTKHGHRGVVLLNGSTDNPEFVEYSEQEIETIKQLGQEYFHRPGVPDIHCRAPKVALEGMRFCGED
jgi:hypothetical protein